mmetsp:Transcript_99716/g.287914  ORF Transcript_99716/g.287914 Transcript_99716/m.287914 type:complete len:472 (+) Transcript_99716:481-1896(+)
MLANGGSTSTALQPWQNTTPKPRLSRFRWQISHTVWAIVANRRCAAETASEAMCTEGMPGTSGRFGAALADHTAAAAAAAAMLSAFAISTFSKRSGKACTSLVWIGTYLALDSSGSSGGGASTARQIKELAPFCRCSTADFAGRPVANKKSKLFRAGADMNFVEDAGCMTGSQPNSDSGVTVMGVVLMRTSATELCARRRKPIVVPRCSTDVVAAQPRASPSSRGDCTGGDCISGTVESLVPGREDPLVSGGVPEGDGDGERMAPSVPRVVGRIDDCGVIGIDSEMVAFFALSGFRSRERHIASKRQCKKAISHMPFTPPGTADFKATPSPCMCSKTNLSKVSVNAARLKAYLECAVSSASICESLRASSPSPAAAPFTAGLASFVSMAIGAPRPCAGVGGTTDAAALCNGPCLASSAMPTSEAGGLGEAAGDEAAGAVAESGVDRALRFRRPMGVEGKAPRPRAGVCGTS